MRITQRLHHRGMSVPAVVASALLLAYGGLRYVDGLDGDHGPGLAWNIGHALFFVALCLFGVVAVRARAALRSGPARSTLAAEAMGATLVGLCGFLWVTLGDLFPALDDAAALPDPLYALCPPLFQFGLLVLFILLSRKGLVPWWTPVLVFAGFTAIGANLDLLPAGAVLILAGLLPLTRRRPALA
ncbi:hypothetical protein [Streptomyces sp. RFCAC02]|uniref:hypothetical protein n=1 Tax=Streptomyces sp. RFCAC02 TaxID=2499143 RepID=UPI001F0DAB38|nr:hypothetical protein [Streptomyces sp. RFCAC02]